MRARSASWRRSSAFACLAAGLTLRCGAGPDASAPGGGSSVDPTTQQWPYTTPLSLFQACPGPLGNTEDLAATPRADGNLELLALVLEPDAVVASEATYQRVVADVAAIRALVPDLAPIAYRPPHDGNTVRIHLEDSGVDAWAMGAFGGWDCLNEALGATVTGIMDNFDFHSPLLVLRGIHGMARVQQLYEQLPGVSGTELFAGPADGPTWCIGRDGSDYAYVIDRAMGGCSSGCREHEAHYFSSAAEGEATPREIWLSTDGEPPPAWYSRLCP